MTTIARMAEVVDRASRDTAFRAELRRAPDEALREAGIDVPAGHEVRVLENTDRVRHLLLSTRPEGFEDDEPGASGSGHPLHAHARLLIDAWSDGGLRARLLADPAAVLRERGLPLPAGTEVRAFEPADGVLYLVLPPVRG